MELYRYLFAPVLLAVAVWLGRNEKRPAPPPERPAAESVQPLQPLQPTSTASRPAPPERAGAVIPVSARPRKPADH